MKIWIISLFFLHKNYVASERAKRIYRYLSKNNDLTIFTTNCGLKGNIKEEFFNIRDIDVMFPDYLFRDSNRNKNHDLNFANFFPKLISRIFRDSGWTWYLQLENSIKKEIKSKGKPNLIIVSGSPFLPFFLCRVINKKYKIPYLLDYRDSWTKNPEWHDKNLLYRVIPSIIESKANKNANGIFTVSRGTCKAILTSKPILVMYNLPDKNYINNLKEISLMTKSNNPNILSLSLTGSIYSFQKLDSFCQAISNLDESLKSNIIIEYCGSNWQYIDEIFSKYNIENNLINHKFLNKKQAIEIVARCDLAISIISTSKDITNKALNGLITTKIFDYIALGKVIINLCFEDYEIIDLLEEIKYKNIININPDYSYEIKDVLENFILEKINLKKINNIGSNNLDALLQKSEQELSQLDQFILTIDKKYNLKS